ncbi:MAG: DUF1800 family protein [Verrucomicrobiota bacterium]|nr:DUF1800 family protein [Verrucomicrobiota bacterium]
MKLQVDVPDGYGHLVVEAGTDILQGLHHPLASGGVNGYGGKASFTLPEAGRTMFFKIRAGVETDPPTATYMGGRYFHFKAHEFGGGPLDADQSANHALNRLAYGPTPSEIEWILENGVENYVRQQLRPGTMDDADNKILNASVRNLFYPYRPGNDTLLVEDGAVWQLKKGDVAPPVNWNQGDYQTTQHKGWRMARSGFGYSNNGSERDLLRTELNDMRQIEEGDDARPGYISFFVRHNFHVEHPDAIDGLLLKMIYDDGFVAYLNGEKIAQANMNDAVRPAYRAKAESASDDPDAAVFDVSKFKSLLRSGDNLLAIELHNTEYDSSDAILVPELIHRKYIPGVEHDRIHDIESLQQLVHAQGLYSSKQLQSVMAEFWENHFTTDYDKTYDYLDDLEDSLARDAMSSAQAAREAAQVEYKEYEFFHQHAFDAFGDLLLYSATSPSMLIYLDNVLNRVGEPNENYAREILELFAFGVDNRYTQQDIEELSRCFTGWQVRKVRPELIQVFPESASQPPTEASVVVLDDPIVDLGEGWRYFKGVTEPVPYRKTISPEWTKPLFNDRDWLEGATSIGYGDDDDATILTDMRRQGRNKGYLSLYLRRPFVLPRDVELNALVLSVDYDDGFIAYINGREVARSSNMENADSPPPFNFSCPQNHNAGGEPDEFNLARFSRFLNPFPETNVLAIQVHNVNLTSSDLSILPRLVRRAQSEESIENGDSNGEWTFRFNPDDHDYASKVLFENTEWEMHVPEGREGGEGLHDALDVVRMMANHPSSREFICVKLVNKFVSDNITLRTYHDESAPRYLVNMVDRAIEAWEEATPVGHIGTVLASLFERSNGQNPFWTQSAYHAKVKTPIEYINSLGRALEWQVKLEDLPEINEEMGMHLFTRDDPDGWSEYGFDWINTGAMLERLNFATRITKYPNNDYLRSWSLRRYLNQHGLETSTEIINHFDKLLFNGTLSEPSRKMIMDFANTDDQGRRSPLNPRRNDYQNRVGQLIGLILAMPEMHYQ